MVSLNFDFFSLIAHYFINLDFLMSKKNLKPQPSPPPHHITIILLYFQAEVDAKVQKSDLESSRFGEVSLLGDQGRM